MGLSRMVAPLLYTSAEGPMSGTVKGKSARWHWRVMVCQHRPWPTQIIDYINQLHELDYYSTFTISHTRLLLNWLQSHKPGTVNLESCLFCQFRFCGKRHSNQDTPPLFQPDRQTRKKKILSRIGAYHGSTHLKIAMTTPAYRKAGILLMTLFIICHHTDIPSPEAG